MYDAVLRDGIERHLALLQGHTHLHCVRVVACRVLVQAEVSHTFDLGSSHWWLKQQHSSCIKAASVTAKEIGNTYELNKIHGFY